MPGWTAACPTAFGAVSTHPHRGRMGQLANLINLVVPQALPVFVTTSGELLGCNPSIPLRPGLADNSSDSTSCSVLPSFHWAG